MGKNNQTYNHIWITIVAIAFIIWLTLWLVAIHNEIPQEIAVSVNALFSAVTVLVASIAIIVSIKAIREDKKALTKQIGLSVFSDAMHSVLKDKKYRECEEYVLSGAVTKDVEIVRKTIQKKETDGVGLNDFKSINNSSTHTTSPTSPILPDETKERIRKSYEKIMYFCSRMEYLGVISSEEQSDHSLIVGYYGLTIRESYLRLYSLIHETRQQDKRILEHYTDMYYRIALPFPVINGNTVFTDSTEVSIVLSDNKNIDDYEIYYTTDGSTPIEKESPLYSKDKPITLTATTTVRAIAYKDGKGSKDGKISPKISQTFIKSSIAG